MKNILMSIIAGVTVLVTSCGDSFLTVTPREDMTGNNFWQTKESAEMFTRGLYASFRNATVGRSKFDGILFFPSTGDFRCAPILRTAGSVGQDPIMNHLDWITQNNLKSILSTYHNTTDRSGWNIGTGYFGFHLITDWSTFYDLVQKANIAIYELEKMSGAAIGEVDRRQLMAEAVFMRSLAYFFMVRLFGDVPYYTEAYSALSIKRTPMLEVLTNIDRDLESHYKNLPWTYSDPTQLGNRAQRGGAIALMMHTNMWLAGFTEGDKLQYYERVDALGKELIDENNGAYTLLPLSQTKVIFKGRTKEGLFEIAQNFNYDEVFGRASTYSDYVLKYPYKAKTVTKSFIHYDKRFLDKMFPATESDGRATVWFQNMYSETGEFIFLKYTNIYFEEGEDVNPNDNQIIFRYADAILLRAEALAELPGRESDARAMLNIVKARANATLVGSSISGEELKNAIWWERTKELLGEGHFFYDLVRTKRVINRDYTTNPMTLAAYNQRGWTWPLSNNAFVGNPLIVQNSYWNN